MNLTFSTSTRLLARRLVCFDSATGPTPSLFAGIGTDWIVLTFHESWHLVCRIPVAVTADSTICAR